MGYSRDVDENLKLRSSRKDELSLSDKIRDFENQLRLLDYDDLEEKKKKLQRQYQEVLNVQNERKGRLSEMTG